MNAQTMASDIQQLEQQSINLPKRILFVGRVSLLEEGLVRLIRDKRHMIISHADDNNPDYIVEKVTQTIPDVIILCHVKPCLVQSLASRLDGLPGIPDRIMINVDLDSTDLSIYQFHRWFSTSFSAFFPLACGVVAEDFQEHDLSM